MTNAKLLLPSLELPQWQTVLLSALEPHHVRVRSLYTGVRHADELACIQREEKQFPFTWGCGVVEEIGDGVQGWKRGDVAAAAMAHQTVQDIDQKSIYPIKNMKPEFAIFMDSGITALCALHQSPVHYGDHIAVVGVGAVGLMVVQYALLSGAVSIAAVDPNETRLHTAMRLGAYMIHQTKPESRYQVVFECSGVDAGLQDAAAMTQEEGTVVMCGERYSSVLIEEMKEYCETNRIEFISLQQNGIQRIAQLTLDSIAAKHAIVWPIPFQLVSLQDAPSAYGALLKNPAEWVKLGILYEMA